MASPLEFQVAVQLRWRDIDLLGHVNQSVYHELLEEGRAGLIGELMRRLGDEPIKGGFVVRHVELDYHHEVRRDHGEVQIVARTGAVGTSSWRIEHEVLLPDGTIAASGATVLVGWDPVTRGKRTLSEAERTVLTG